MSIATRIDLRPAAWLATLFGLVVSGCTGLTPVDGTDSRAFLPSMRIAWELSSSATSSPSSSSAQPHSGRAMELFVVHGSGDSTQSLNAGQQPIQFGGTTFSAPLAIREQFEFSLAALSYRWRKIFGGGVGLEVLGGVGYGTLDATLDAGAQHGQENRGRLVVPFAAGVIWNLTPSTSLQGRGTVGLTSRFSLARGEAVVVQAIAKNVALRAGWVSWTMNDEITSGSDVHFKLSGPTLGLDLEF